MSDQATSPLPVLQVRCLGCDYIQRHGNMSLQGDEVGIHVTEDRCVECDGRMQELYLRRVRGRK